MLKSNLKLRLVLFLKSIIFGSEGSYKFFDINVVFEKTDNSQYLFAQALNNPLAKPIGHLADCFLKSKAFRIATQGYLHTFIHEMGHALARKLLGKHSPSISINTKNGGGFCTTATDEGILSNKENFIISFSGPATDMAFSTCKLLATIALRPYIPKIAVVAMVSSSAIWMIGELFLALTSALNKDHGDFGKIRECGPKYLWLASIGLVGQLSFAIIYCYRLKST
jgi:hypothetical protein